MRLDERQAHGFQRHAGAQGFGDGVAELVAEVLLGDRVAGHANHSGMWMVWRVCVSGFICA